MRHWIRPSIRNPRPALVRALPLVLGLSVGACGDETTNPVGDLSRPAGLVYVERPDRRGDLFIADAEVDGVRLQQFQLLPVGTSTALVQEFALAPSVFAPLIIPTPGFPSEMAFAPGNEDLTPIPECDPTADGPVHTPEPSTLTDGRLYVLSPIGVSVDPASGEERVGLLHIIDARDTFTGSLPTRGSGPGLEDLGEISLQATLEMFGEARGRVLLPVDVKVLSSSRLVDILAVVFDSLDEESAQVALFEVTFSADGALLGVMLLERMEPVADPPPGGPERGPGGGARAPAFIPGTEAGRAALVVPSARNQWVTPLILADDLRSIDGPAALVDVGGPTDSAVAAGDRVVVNRTDRPAMVVLVRDADGVGFSRDPRVYDSPYTASDDREGRDEACCAAPGRCGPGVPDYCGRIDLPSPVSTSVYVDRYPRDLIDPDLSNTATVSRPAGRICPSDPGGTGAERIACRCDPVLFVVHTNGLATFVVRDPFEVTVSSSTAVTRTTPMTEFSEVRECVLTTAGSRLPEDRICNLNASTAADGCAGNPVIQVVPNTTVRYRAELLGSLYVSRTGTLSLGRGDALFALGDSSIVFSELWDERLIRPGDRVRATMSVEDGCQRNGQPEVQDVGTIESFEPGDVLEARFPGLGERIDLEAPECSGTLDRVVYEIWPGDESAVVKQMAGEQIVRPVERVPYQFESATQLLVADFDRPLNITVTSSRAVETNTSPGAAPCVDAQPFYCETPADCGAGRACLASPDNAADIQCRSACAEECSGPGCLDSERFRRCDGVELTLRPTLGAQISLRDPGTVASEIVAAVPSGAVFHPLFPGFVVSAPASRTLIQVIPTLSSYVVDVTR